MMTHQILRISGNAGNHNSGKMPNIMHAANVDNAMHTSLLEQKYAELWLAFLS
jgi:hypothetical protein